MTFIKQKVKDKQFFAKTSYDRRWRNEAEAVEEHVSGNVSGGVAGYGAKENTVLPQMNLPKAEAAAKQRRPMSRNMQRL